MDCWTIILCFFFLVQVLLRRSTGNIIQQKQEAPRGLQLMQAIVSRQAQATSASSPAGYPSA